MPENAGTSEWEIPIENEWTPEGAGIPKMPRPCTNAPRSAGIIGQDQGGALA